MTILGISIGTRRIGIGILKHPDLLDWKVSVFKGEWSKQKLTTILSALAKPIERFSIDAVAIKVPSLMEHSFGLSILLSAFQKELKARGIPYESYTIHQLKAHCLPAKPRNKKALIQCIANKYPEVFTACKKEETNRNPHYIKMVEAIVAADVHYRHILRYQTEQFDTLARKSTRTLLGDQ